ncbi:hypothetical protein C0993_002002 [Termitomyces sp. T159_Od127]|nr:hypothetical protein C0993_002002 [Termitomyces sp. T159_Od127]
MNHLLNLDSHLDAVRLLEVYLPRVSWSFDLVSIQRLPSPSSWAPKVALRRVLCVVLFPLLELRKKFSSSPVVRDPRAGCCPKVDGSRQMCSWRLQPRERPWKKVLPVLLYVSSSPDVFPRSVFPFREMFIQIAGVRGTITRFVITIPTPATTYHFYEMDVAALDSDWLEKKERRREWVDYAEACRRLEWKSELSQGLQLSSLAPSRSY